MNIHFNTILSDLLNTVPTFLTTVSCPTNESQDLQKRITTTYRKLLRTNSSQRKKQLAYAYYLGKLLEEYPEERRTSRRKISAYYYRVAIRTYNIFHDLGLEQIFRTNTTTLFMISSLSSSDYHALF